jgi:SNF2 family DNA or RNA helicase
VYSYKLQEKEYSEIIHEKIEDLCVSMSTEDYLDLPPLIENDIFVQFDDKLAAKYEEFQKEKVLEIFGDGEPVTAATAQALRIKLLQFCNGAVYDKEKTYHEVHKLKLEALEEVVDSASGKPVLVSVCFRFDFERISNHFKSLKPVKMVTDDDVSRWNAGKIPLMMMHPASGGHGLNLQYGSNHMALFGLNPSLELHQQFIKRVHRQGNTNERVFLHRILTRGTHEDKIARNLINKDDVQKGLIDAVKDLRKKYLKNF